MGKAVPQQKIRERIGAVEGGGNEYGKGRRGRIYLGVAFIQCEVKATTKQKKTKLYRNV